MAKVKDKAKDKGKGNVNGVQYISGRKKEHGYVGLVSKSCGLGTLQETEIAAQFCRIAEGVVCAQRSCACFLSTYTVPCSMFHVLCSVHTWLCD